MILSVKVTEYRRDVDAHVISLARDSNTAAVLRRDYAKKWFDHSKQWPWQADLNAGRGFQWQVVKYAEVVTKEPWKDVQLYFDLRAKVGGPPTPSTITLTGPLKNPARYPILNTAAMAAASEALAGWFCREYYDWDFVARPPRVTPDLEFWDKNEKRFALVEVKSSARMSDIQKLQNKLVTDMIKLLKVLHGMKYIDKGLYYVGVIAIQISSPTDVRLTSLLLRET